MAGKSRRWHKKNLLTLIVSGVGSSPLGGEGLILLHYYQLTTTLSLSYDATQTFKPSSYRANSNNCNSMDFGNIIAKGKIMDASNSI
jgi:hypothetical protein